VLGLERPDCGCRRGAGDPVDRSRVDTVAAQRDLQRSRGGIARCASGGDDAERSRYEHDQDQESADHRASPDEVSAPTRRRPILDEIPANGQSSAASRDSDHPPPRALEHT
jgi:hypothetical protein